MSLLCCSPIFGLALQLLSQRDMASQRYMPVEKLLIKPLNNVIVKSYVAQALEAAQVHICHVGCVFHLAFWQSVFVKCCIGSVEHEVLPVPTASLCSGCLYARHSRIHRMIIVTFTFMYVYTCMGAAVGRLHGRKSSGQLQLQSMCCTCCGHCPSGHCGSWIQSPATPTLQLCQR